MNPILLGVGIFIVTVSIIELLLFARRAAVNPDRRRVRRRLDQLRDEERDAMLNSIVRTDNYSKVPLFNRILKNIPLVGSLKKLKDQANAPQSVGFYIFLSLVLGLAGAAFVIFTRSGPLALVLVTGIGLFLPWARLGLKKKKRMDRFRRQLPEAMELIARSLRAGHAFNSGLKLAADQMSDPIGVEFAATIHQINFGISVTDALRNLADRVDCPDLRIFVVSVILQRETGGNLAEIMESNARIIRERFKFYKHVRTLSAEGRMSAWVLFLLPILVALAIQFLNPEYMATLYTSELGQKLLWFAAGLMTMGMIIIRRMVNIEA